MSACLYTDDTAFCLGRRDMNLLNSELNSASNNFEMWCKLNRLTLNQRKCKTQFFSPSWQSKNPIDTMNLNIQGVNIDNTKEFKYLGVILDGALSFESHINMLKMMIVTRLFIDSF